MNPRPGFAFALAAALVAAALHFSASGCAQTPPPEVTRCVEDAVAMGFSDEEAETLCGGPKVRDIRG